MYKRFAMLCLFFHAPLFSMHSRATPIPTLQEIPEWCVGILDRYSEAWKFPISMQNEQDCKIVEILTNNASALLERDGRKPYWVRAQTLHRRGIQSVYCSGGEETEYNVIRCCEKKPDMQVLKGMYEAVIADMAGGWKRETWRHNYHWRHYPHMFCPDNPENFVLIIRKNVPENTHTLLELLVQKLGIQSKIRCDHCADPDNDPDWPGRLNDMAYCWIPKDAVDEVVAVLGLRIE